MDRLLRRCQIGYKWGTSKHTYEGLQGGVNFTAGYGMTPNYNLNGAMGGAEAGCNYQVGSWVYGVEVDGSWSTAEGQATNINYPGLGFFSPLWVSKTSRALAHDGAWPPSATLPTSGSGT